MSYQAMRRHRTLKCTLLSESSQSEKVTHCTSNYMTLWKRQNCGDTKKISGCQGLGEGKNEQAEHGKSSLL